MRTTPAAAATTASRTSPRRPRRVGSRSRSPSSRTSACARVTTSSPILAADGCGRASRWSRRALVAAAWLADRYELLRGLVPALDLGPGRLAHAVVGDQALLMDRVGRPRVAAVPARPHPELVQRPVDRAAEPWLRADHAELVVDPFVLEGPGALLLSGAVAVGL